MVNSFNKSYLRRDNSSVVTNKCKCNFVVLLMNEAFLSKEKKQWRVSACDWTILIVIEVFIKPWSTFAVDSLLRLSYTARSSAGLYLM